MSEQAKWRVDRYGTRRQWVQVLGDDGKQVCNLGDSDYPANVVDRHAAMIVAAPDLAAACEKAANVLALVGKPGWDENRTDAAWRACVAALSKARPRGVEGSPT